MNLGDFASVHERRKGRCLMLAYKEQTSREEIEEVVVNLQGFLLESTLPPIRQFQ